MARRLTDQQRRRIAGNQARRRENADNAAPVADSQEDSALGGEETAVVIARYGSQIDVERADGTLLRCHLRANLTALVAGDRVIIRAPVNESEPGATEDEACQDGAACLDTTASRRTGIVVACCERSTVLSRPDSRGLLRPVAANIDTLLVTIAPQPEPFPFLIDRYLVAADLHGINAVILCNKADMLTADRRDTIDALLHIYRSIGYPVFSASSDNGSGLPALAYFLRDKTAVVVGQSGVGKSSLIRALLPGTDIAVGALSEGVEKGRHTTTTARLYHLSDGGQLIDSPGIREFTLQHLPASELLSHFVDLRCHAEHCKFRDCRHEQEPGCALLAAEQAGTVFPERLASYRHILASLG